MKTVSLVLLLMASMASVLLGCSDNSAPLVSPTDQSAQAAASLAKSTNLTTPFYLNSPKDLTAGGEIRYVGGNLQIKKYEVKEEFQTTETRVAGQVIHFLSLTVDVATGEGPCHGSLTIYPTTGDGVWEGTYEGYRSKTDIPYHFTLPLKGVAHGKGGTIDKMQSFYTITLDVLTTGDPLVAPPQVPIYWSGEGSITIKEH